MKNIRTKITKLILNNIEKEVDIIVNELMDRFDKYIVVHERENCRDDDPGLPSFHRDEFELFLRETIQNNIIRGPDYIKISIGDDQKLGFGERLDEETTDSLKIVGTVLQGIVGEYVFVEEVGEGRFGEGFLLPEAQYRLEAVSKGWDPYKPIWCFSNFPGIPDFFEGLDLNEVLQRIIDKSLRNVGRL